MNILEKQMVDLLIDLKENHSIISVKAEFEAEGTRMDEAMRLKEVSMKAGLELTIKIGGCEALKDMFEASSLGTKNLVAPMVETPYALQKYLRALKIAYNQEQRNDMLYFVNIETITAFNNLEKMLEIPEINLLNGIVLGRTDMTGSLGMSSDDINNQRILDICLKAAEIATAKNLHVVVGGGVSFQSLPFFQCFPAGHLYRFETRKIVFQCPGALNNQESAFLKALEFELLWLKNKKNYYGNIHREDDIRVETIEKRYRKSIDAALDQ